MTVCGWCIGAICAGIAALINSGEVLNLEMLAMEVITFFVVQAVAGIMIAIRRRRERANCAANRNFNYFCNLLYNWFFSEG